MGKEHKEAIQKMQKTYDEFIMRIDDLKAKADDIVRSQITDDDEQKLKDIQKKLKHIN